VAAADVIVDRDKPRAKSKVTPSAPGLAFPRFFTEAGVNSTRAASRRACSVSSLPSVIMRSTSGLTALALVTVVMTRSSSITLVTSPRSRDLRAPPSRFSLYPATLCRMV